MNEIVKRSFEIAGQKKSISLEAGVWISVQEIARHREMTLSDLIISIASTEYEGNLSSVIRLYVLNFYREQLEFQCRQNVKEAAFRTPIIQALH